ncbi:uncharacterized protein N7511_004673 [Penicillium nucicola]|uniref:uncharacterized protein n=1 Tax=Penicillium nucicola TaxID=1850975 RepID=UPI0025459E2E|nr:uncharacterized protein N7511_004673 [Penicillium nucicola]KAJ5767057.1 hypothetical protein N7511_004673 [Penicillium nucicola]
MSDPVENDYNLQEAWDRACTSFAQTAKVDLTTAPKFTVDQVLDQIRTKQDEDDEKNNKYKTAKDVIGKTLNFVMVLGGIAAQGASMVFAPSSLCFNAISYLISTGAKYKRIFSSLSELFRRISDVLERCKIYMRLPADAVDISLRKIINEELVCFVDICALSIKVLKGHKVFTALKVFAFDSDEGVSGQLGRLQTLVERESQMRATLGFESQKTSERNIIENKEGTKKINTTVDKLLTFEKKKDADNVVKRLLNNIDSSLDTPSETYKASQTVYKRLLNDQVQGSGAWLQTDPQYTSWAGLEDESFSILGISGGEGYGKSFLFAAIVQHLQETPSHVTNDLKCISTAYHIFEQEKGDASLIKALKVLAWQIANTDVVYRKDLSSSKFGSVNQIDDVWEALYAKSYKCDSTFFLLLDGVDQMSKNHLKDFTQLLSGLKTISQTWPRFKLRILLSGRDKTMSKIKTQIGEGISIIDVASKNSDDMQKFVIDRMNKMEILGGSSDQVLSLRREILQALTTQTHGDFVNVGLMLHEISGKQRPGEIRDILSRSGGNRSDTIVRKMELLNETLSDEDISDLNDLLTWVVFASRPLTLEELEAVLFLKTREASLRPLAEKISDQYSSLFKVLGDPNPTTKIIPPTSRVLLVSDSIEEFLRTTPENEAAENEKDAINRGDVNEVEVRIVKRFLESVCDPKLFNKFGFEDFFQRKLKGKTARVGVDVESAHLKIVTSCLDVLCSEQSPGLTPLLDYAMNFLPVHLQSADPSLTQPQQKSALGPQLVSLFYDEEIIQRWWIAENPWSRHDWIYSDDYADVALKWLRDSAVTRNISVEQTKWVKSLSSKSEPDADIIEHIGRFLARNWLQTSVLGITEAFAAFNGYATKIENRKNPTLLRSTSDPSLGDISASQILDTAEYARKHIGLENLGYEETRNLARTLREYHQYPEAIEKFKLASSLDAYNWFSEWGLATCYAYKKDYTLAIEIVEEAKKVIRAGNNEEDHATIPDLDCDLAEWNGNAGNIDQAVAIYESLLHANPDDYNTALALMLLFHNEKNREGLLRFLDSLKESIDETTGLDRRTQAFHAHYGSAEYHATIFAVGSEADAFNFIFESYETAINAAKARLVEARKTGDTGEEEFSRACQAMLMHHLANLCYENSTEKPERKELAIDQWVQILQMDDSAGDYTLTSIKPYVRSKLASVCFIEARRDIETSGKYVEQLEQLVALKSASVAADWCYSTYPTRLLARHYAIQGEKEKFKDALRTYVKDHLEILVDEDPLNDWQGYAGLSTYLMYVGEDDDCLAAWSLIVPTPDTDLNRESPEDKSSEELRGPLYIVCDGKCGTKWSFSNDIYACRQCDDIQLDLACLNKLRDGTLEVNGCGKDHEMIHVPAYDAAELEEIGDGNVKVGEQIMSVEDWIQRLKENWGIKLS